MIFPYKMVKNASWDSLQARLTVTHRVLVIHKKKCVEREWPWLLLRAWFLRVTAPPNSWSEFFTYHQFLIALIILDLVFPGSGFVSLIICHISWIIYSIFVHTIDPRPRSDIFLSHNYIFPVNFGITMIYSYLYWSHKFPSDPRCFPTCANSKMFHNLTPCSLFFNDYFL